MVSLNNKTIIITGASSGLGKALAIRLSEENCNLVLSARRLNKLHEVELKIKNSTSRYLLVQADISEEKDVIKLFKDAINKFGQVDILVNNAGVGLPRKIQDITKEDWDNVIHTNLDGVFLASREAVNHMIKNNNGHIITICSIAGLYGAPGYSAYCASKHAVAGFKRSLWLELRNKGIKISTLYPGRINTEFFKNYDKKPSNRQMVSAEEIADYIVSIMKRQKLRTVLKKIKLLSRRLANLVGI